MTLPAWLAACPARFRRALAACAGKVWRPEMVLLDVLRLARSDDELGRVLRAAALATGTSPLVAGRLDELQRALSQAPEAWHTVSRILQQVHGASARQPASGVEPLGERIEGCARRFDRAAADCPEASVALYSFGDPARLARASEELAQRARTWGFPRPEARYLDLGCGIGRMESALAPHVRFITGVDISARMIELARQRCRAVRNAAFELVNGRDLAGFSSRSLGGVLAVDSFPYLVECGEDLAEHLLDECRRVLEPGGQLLILNFSYRGDLDADRADLARWAKRSGMILLKNGVRELHTWDGAAFQLLAPN